METVEAMTIESMESQGLEGEEMDMAMGIATSFLSPGGMAGATLVGSIFGGTLISLIVGAIMKRD